MSKRRKQVLQASSNQPLVSIEYSILDEASEDHKNSRSDTGRVRCVAKSKESKGEEVLKMVLSAFKMHKTNEFKLYGYKVAFEPPEDAPRLKVSLMSQHSERFGNFMSNGSMLYCGRRLPEMMLKSKHPAQTNRTEYALKITKELDIDPGDKLYKQFYYVAIRCEMEKLGLVPKRRDFCVE